MNKLLKTSGQEKKAPLKLSTRAFQKSAARHKAKLVKEMEKLVLKDKFIKGS